MGVFVRPLIDTVVGRVRPMLQLLTGAVAFLLLIASANVSNVLLARGLRREYETAVRTALGAGRARLVRLFLMESLIVSLIGGAAGLLLAAWSVRVCRGLPGFLLPRASELAIDGTVLAYSLVLTIATSMLFGLAPSLHLSRAGWMARLRHVGATSSGSPGSRRLRSTLVGLEVALSLALLMGAGLMMRTMARLADVDPDSGPTASSRCRRCNPVHRMRTRSDGRRSATAWSRNSVPRPACRPRRSPGRWISSA